MKLHNDRSHLEYQDGETTNGPCYKCDICHRTFYSEYNLSRHKQSHHSEKKNWPCSKCDKVFSCAEYLRDHNLLHEDAEAFKCSTCDKCFMSKKNLKNHMKSKIAQLSSSSWCVNQIFRMTKQSSLKFEEDLILNHVQRRSHYQNQHSRLFHEHSIRILCIVFLSSNSKEDNLHI